MTYYTRDRSGRRRRLHPTSTGKRITPQPRDLTWFAALREHGALPSSFLLEYSKQTHRSGKRALDRLTDLFNEDNTPHGGTYLSRPLQQFKTVDSRYNQLVYDLTPAAYSALADANLPHGWSGNSGPWLHSHMVACITASIELETINDAAVTYIPQSHLLARAQAKLQYQTQLKNPATDSTVTKKLMPDALFGLRYETVRGPRYRCFVLEADRGSEPLTSPNIHRKSWQRNLLQYEQYIGRGLYRGHLKLKAPLMLLVVSSDESLLKKLSPLIREDVRSLTASVLFQHCSSFNDLFKPPLPCALSAQSWVSTQGKTFAIGELNFQ